MRTFKDRADVNRAITQTLNEHGINVFDLREALISLVDDVVEAVMNGSFDEPDEPREMIVVNGIVVPR